MSPHQASGALSGSTLTVLLGPADSIPAFSQQLDSLCITVGHKERSVVSSASSVCPFKPEMSLPACFVQQHRVCTSSCLRHTCLACMHLSQIGLTHDTLSSPSFRHLRADTACQARSSKNSLHNRTNKPFHQQLSLVLAWLLPDCPLAISARSKRSGLPTAHAGSSSSSKPPAPFDASQLYAAVKPTGCEAQFRGDPQSCCQI